MKKILLLLLTVFANMVFGQNNITLLSESFESGSGNYTSSGVCDNCGGGYLFKRTQNTGGCFAGTSFSNIDGSWFWTAQDNDATAGGCATGGTVTFSAISLGAYDNIRLRFRAAATNGNAHASDDIIRFQYREGGGSWTNVVRFFGWDGNVSETMTENGQQNGTALSQSFQTFTYSLPASVPTSGQVEIRFYMIMDANSEAGVDLVELIGDCALPLPQITTLSADGTNNICPGQTVDLKTGNYSGDYKWYKDGVAIPNSNAQQITITESARYRVEFVGRTCNDTNSVFIGEYVPAPYSTISASGQLTFCDYENVVLTADETSDSYMWFQDGNALTSETTTSIEPRDYGSGDYQILLTSKDGCETFSEVKTVVVHYTQRPKVFENNQEVTSNDVLEVCQDYSLRLETGNKSAPDYKWYRNGALLNGETDFFLDIVYPDSGYYQVQVTEPNTCTRISDSINVRTLPAPAQPTIQASGSTFRCEGDSVKLRSTANGPGGYKWYLDGFEIIGADQRDYFAKEDGSYEVEVFSDQGCSRISPAFGVTVYPKPNKPTLNVGDTTELCRGDDITLVSSNAADYQWFLNNNPIANARFKGYTANTEGNYFVRIEDQNGCFNYSDTVYIRTNIDQVASIVANGSTTICPDDEVILTSNYQKGNQWFYNGKAVTGTKTQEFAARDSGIYFSVVSINGCTDTTNSIQVDLYPRPTAPVITPGDTAVCDGSNITFTASNSPNYQWYLDGQEIANANSSTYTATTSGLYFVEVVDANGCTNRDTVEFFKFFEDPVVVTPSDTTICADASITFTSNYSKGNQWYFNGSPIAGATDQLITVDQAGSYYVKVSINACVDSSEVVNLATNFAQSQPVITNNGSNLYCPGDSTELVSTNAVQYQWLRNGTEIPGANGKRLYPKEAGDYQVIAFNQFGCSDTSGTESIFTHPGPELTNVTTENNTCPGFSDGGITTSASGGTQPYEFSVDGNTWQPNGNFPNLGGGTYLLQVRDANGCGDSLEVQIIDNPTDLAISTAVFDASCWDIDDGKIFVSATGGQPPYEFSIDGINYQTSDEFSGLATGKYLARVRDNFGCEVFSDSLIVNSPDELIVQAQLENPISCAGESDAFITATALGGTPNYFFSIDGVNFQSSSQFPNLGPGIYQITLQDLNGCERVSDPILIEDPDTLKMDFAQVVQNVNCFGEKTGLISVGASGGTPPYEFSIDGVNYSAQQVISNLPAGEFVVTVRDSRFCTDESDTLIVTEGDELNISAQVGNHVDCFGYSTGQLIVGATGGTGPLEYSIDLVNYQPNGVFNGLPARTYDNITVRDSLGCVIFAEPVTINQPAPFELFGNLTQPISCAGAGDAVISMSSIGGAGGNTFSIDGGNSFFNDSIFTNLSPGTYNLVVQDAQGCQAQSPDPILIEEPAPLVLDTVLIDHLTCNGLGNGVINIFAQGGTPPLSYSVNGGQSFDTNPVVNSLSAGNYQVVIQDSRGCTLQGPAITLLQPDSLKATAAVTSPVSCNGVSDAVITVSSTGGNGGHLYSIDGGNTFQGSNVFSGLGAGVYTIQVNDNLDCQTILSVQVTEPSPITLTSLQKLDVSCNSAMDGKILAQATGGTGILYYSIDGGQTFQTNGIFNDLGPDSYTLVVKDTNDCESSPVQINVIEPDSLLTGLAVVSPINCNGIATGTLKALTNGGTKPYQYSLNGAPPVSDSIFDNLQPGNYSVTVTDAKGCVVNSSVSALSAPPAMNVSASVLGQLSCHDSDDGTISASATGGVGNYQYALDTNNFGPSNVFTNLPAGTYTVYVKDGNDCIVETNEVELLNPNELFVNINVDYEVSCFGGSDAQITAWSLGGNGNKLYSLNGGPLTSVPVFENLSAGQFVVTAVDDNGCAVSDTVQLNNPTELVISLDDYQVATNGNNGYIRLDVQGGTPPYTYIWNNGATTEDIFNLSNGTYSVTVTDDNDCKKNFQFQLPGISIEEEGMSFQLYPNPSTGIVFMEWENSGLNGDIRVYNGIGEVILSKTKEAGSQRIEIDLSNYPSGIYQVEFSRKGERKVHSLVIE